MSSCKERNIKAYDKKADHYDDSFDGKFTEKFKVLLLSSMTINDGDSVLDIGCGNGSLLSKIAAVKEINGFGTDISPGMIASASARCPKFKFAVGGCDEIPFDDNWVDIITVCAAYHHFPDVDAFALEAKRLLKQGGNIYIAEVYLPAAIRHIANIFMPFSKEGDVKFYSSKEIARTFSDAGFALVNTIKKRHIQIIQMQRQ